MASSRRADQHRAAPSPYRGAGRPEASLHDGAARSTRRRRRDEASTRPNCGEGTPIRPDTLPLRDARRPGPTTPCAYAGEHWPSARLRIGRLGRAIAARCAQERRPARQAAAAAASTYYRRAVPAIRPSRPHGIALRSARRRSDAPSTGTDRRTGQGHEHDPMTQMAGGPARRRSRAGEDPSGAGRHRQRRLGRGHRRLALGGHRRHGAVARRRQGHRQGTAHRRAPAGGRGRRHRVRERALLHRRHRPRPIYEGSGARRVRLRQACRREWKRACSSTPASRRRRKPSRTARTFASSRSTRRPAPSS